MGNIYTTKEGLKKMEVEYGWGVDMEATYFPVELAKEGVIICSLVFLQDENNLTGKLNIPSVDMLLLYCNEVIENSKDGNDTYVLDEFMIQQLREIQNISNYLNK